MNLSQHILRSICTFNRVLSVDDAASLRDAVHHRGDVLLQPRRVFGHVQRDRRGALVLLSRLREARP